MTLIIYLDTQDYIKLFNEPDDGPNHRVLTKLLKYRDRGDIIIPFSFAIILEFITKPDAANRHERVRRGQLVKDICGPNAFPFPSEMPEVISFPNNGIWMHSSKDKLITAKQFRKRLHIQLVDGLKDIEGLNRNKRRQLSRKGSLAELSRSIGSTWGRKRSDWGDIPVSDEFIQSRILERFIKGQCSDREFEQRINSWFSDPAEYSRIVYDYQDQPNVIDHIFGESIDKIERQAQNLQEVVRNIREFNEEIIKHRADLVAAGFSKSEARKVTKQFSFPKQNYTAFESELEMTIGKGRARHISHYIARLLKPNYNFKRSDMMDLFQMCYAYDCDLFRCDKSMASTFRTFEPFQGKLVDRFADLPARIDLLVNER